MLKKTLLLAALLTASSGLFADGYEDLRRDTKSQLAVMSHYSEKSEKWWSDYKSSGKEITLYVKGLSEQNPEAAMWFLVTGGKYGFSKQKATKQQEEFLLYSLKTVACKISHSQTPDLSLETWKGIVKQDGQLHLKMIYDRIDRLNKANTELTSRVGRLEVEISTLKNDLKIEREARIKDVQKEQLERNRERDNLAQQMRDNEDRWEKRRNTELEEARRLSLEQRREDDLRWKEIRANEQSKFENRIEKMEAKHEIQMKNIREEVSQARRDSQEQTSNFIKTLNQQSSEFSNNLQNMMQNFWTKMEKIETDLTDKFSKERDKDRKDAQERERLLIKNSKVEKYELMDRIELLTSSIPSSYPVH